jgi:ankyrin repeat protein
MTRRKATQEIINEFIGACHGDMARVQYLVDQYASVIHTTSSWGETPLGAAAHVGNRQIVRFLLSQGVALDIFAATVLGWKSQVEWLLDEDPDLVNAPGAHQIPLLSHAVAAGQREIVELLLERGADIDGGRVSHTALHAAAFFGHAGLAELLISRGADLQARDHQNRTPLQIAVENGQEEVAALLRRHGAAA